MKNKRRNGAQPEMKSLFRGHGGFPIKQKGEAVSLSFALERHLWRPRSIACQTGLSAIGQGRKSTAISKEKTQLWRVC